MDNLKIYAFADEASPHVEEQIRAMVRNQLNGLEIRGVDGMNIADITAEKAKEVRRRLDDAGLATWSIGSPIGKIGITDPFAPHLDQFKHTMELADVLGAKNIRLFSFFIPQNEPAARYTEAVMERMAAFLDAAQGSGIRLCHENEKEIYGDTAERCLELHRTFPELKGVFDPANFVQCGVDTLQAWDMLKEYVHYMHIKDALPSGKVVPAGHGAGHVAQIAAEYRRMGGTVFTIEPHLTVFDGFAKLEKNGVSIAPEYTYPDAQTAFDAACGAFRKLL